MRRLALLLLLTSMVLAWSGCNRQHKDEAFLPTSPEFSGALTVTPLAPSIPADGFSRVEIRAEITGAADLNKRTVRLETDNGDFPDSSITGKKSIEEEVNSNGVVVVELRSSTSATIATITAQVLKDGEAIDGLISRAIVEFTPAEAVDILRLLASSLTGEADGASVISITAEVSDELPINQNVTFKTTKGKFLNGSAANTTSTTIEVDIGRRATAELESPMTPGSALITAEVMDTTREIEIEYDPALPEVIVVNLSERKLERDGTEMAKIDLILSRAVGKVSEGTPIEYDGFEKAYGEPLEFLFFEQTLSTSSETASAMVGLGRVDFVGTATIRATVDGVSGEADIEIDAPGPEPDIKVTPPNLDFGMVDVDDDSDLDLKIENEGKETLVVSALETSGGDFSIPAKPALPLELAEGGSVDITVRFEPESEGPQSGTLTITSNDPNKGELAVSLTGEGEPGPEPEITIMPDSLDFGSVMVGDTEDEKITISNVGMKNLRIKKLRVSGGEFSISAQPPSPTVIEPGDSVDVMIRFSPSAAGMQTGTLRITSNDPDENVLQVFLTGTGT